MLDVYVVNEHDSARGVWIYLPCEYSQELDTIFDGEDKDDYLIKDYRCDVDGLEISEYDTMEDLNALADLIERPGVDVDVLSALIMYDGEIDCVLSHLDDVDVYEGCWTMAAVAKEKYWYKHDEDFESLGEELWHDGHFVEYDGGYIELLGW